jgi:ATP-dependent protease ClpP protease subunit
VQYFFFLLQIQTVAVGAAIGQACLLLAAGEKGRRYMMPHATGLHLLPKGFLLGVVVFQHHCVCGRLQEFSCI